MKGKVLSAFSSKKFYLLFENSIDTSIKQSDREIKLGYSTARSLDYVPAEP